MLVDDNKGVAEALNEREFNQGMVARGKHYLIFGKTDNANEGGILIFSCSLQITFELLLLFGMRQCLMYPN